MEQFVLFTFFFHCLIKILHLIFLFSCVKNHMVFHGCFFVTKV